VRIHTHHNACLLVPLFIDLSFVYLRRLADHFANPIRHAFFGRFDTVSPQYKKLRRLIVDRGGELERYAPICDLGKLQNAFKKHSVWFDLLRAESPPGIRKMMEHHSTAVRVQEGKIGDGPWGLQAFLGEPGLNANFVPDLFTPLKEIIADLCGLWTQVCDAVWLKPAQKGWIAPRGDFVGPIGGDTDDFCGFWPEI
jgi:hypothetical protein